MLFLQLNPRSSEERNLIFIYLRRVSNDTGLKVQNFGWICRNLVKINLGHIFLFKISDCICATGMSLHTGTAAGASVICQQLLWA